MKKVKIYSLPTCPHCIDAKAFLKEKKIDFEDIDISKNQKAADEMVEKTGQRGVPVLEIGEDIIIGFDKEKISDILGLE